VRVAGRAGRPDARALACRQSDSATRLRCGRAGAQTITIIGSNFGASNAEVRYALAVLGLKSARTRTQVFVGGQPCVGVVHDAATPHRRLRCRLPAGWAPSQPLLVLQGGQLSAGTVSTQDVAVSYTPCAAGNFQNGTAVACGPCLVGDGGAWPS
jgi:hypothetical protein